MGIIIELMGCRGVGKSTLIKKLKDSYMNCQAIEGFRKIDNGYDVNTLDGFIKNEREYIHRSINESKTAMKSNHMTIITSGPRDIMFYLMFYMELYHPEWPLLNLLKEDIKALKKVYSPFVIYLFATDEKIRYNIRNDKSKNRMNLEFWIKYSHYVQDKMKEEGCIYRINTTNMSAEKVFLEVMQFLSLIKE